jgi:hypothetical protein
MRTTRLVATGDWDALRQIPGIAGYRPYFRAGEVPGAGVMTNPLDLVCGEAESHQQMLKQIDQMWDTLVYRFDIDGRQQSVAARFLPDLGVRKELG